ncbi:MAG: TPM domain-containing protein [Flavobacteriales bacterium Tduv]
MKSKKKFLSREEEQQVVQSIKQAERETSGEIRVHIRTQTEENISTLDMAQKAFSQLGIDQTKDRNGVLFYISVNQRNLTILGDKGINKSVPPEFWNEIKEKVIQKFKEQKYCQGLIEGIDTAGQALKKYFPYKKDDINELPDDISKD